MNIELKIRPLTYNHYYRHSKSGKPVKTGAGLAYEEELDMILEDYAIALSEYGRKFDPLTNILRLSITHFNPKFYIKDNSRLNMKAGDVDGSIKVLQDKVFNLMGIDDYVIKSLRSDQYPGAEDVVRIELDEISLSLPEYRPIRKD